MNWDGIISILILLFLAFVIYSKIKKQRLRESFDELKELVATKEK